MTMMSEQIAPDNPPDILPVPWALLEAAFVLYAVAEDVLKEPGDQDALDDLADAYAAFAKAHADSLA